MKRSIRPTPRLVQRRACLAILASCAFFFRGIQEPWIHGHDEQGQHDHGDGIVHAHWALGSTTPSWKTSERERETRFLDAAMVVPDSVDAPAETVRRYVGSHVAASLHPRSLVEPRVHSPPCAGIPSLRSPPPA
jgi:hypothetical protein